MAYSLPGLGDGKCGFAGVVTLHGVPTGPCTLLVQIIDTAGNIRAFKRKIVVKSAVDEVYGTFHNDGPEAVERQGDDQLQPKPTELSVDALPMVKLTTFLASGVRLAFPEAAEPLVSVVVPTYQKAHYTLDMLFSLLADSRDVPFEVIVVDNQSTDQTRALLGRVDNIRVQLNATNVGFGDACNQGAVLARGKYLCFLNSDTLVTPGWLAALVETMESYPRCGAAGAKLVHPHGRLQEAGAIIWRDGRTGGYGRGQDPLDPEFTYVREVDYCSAACLMIRKDLFSELGGFDCRYSPMYYEDVDLCLSVWKAGYPVVYQPRATVIHVERGSGLRSNAVALAQRSQEQLRAKWGPAVSARDEPTELGIFQLRDRRPGRRVLVLPPRLPRLPSTPGELSVALLEGLVQLKYLVTLLATDSPSSEAASAAIDRLQRQGVEVLPRDIGRARSDVNQRAGLYEAILASPGTDPDLMELAAQSNPRAATLVVDCAPHAEPASRSDLGNGPHKAHQSTQALAPHGPESDRADADVVSSKRGWWPVVQLETGIGCVASADRDADADQSLRTLGQCVERAITRTSAAGYR